jgi:choice-of-anchor A domain-containing protein
MIVNKDATSTADLTQAVADAQNASLTAIGLTATQTVLTQVTGSRIFTGNGGLNVVNLTQGMNLSGIISIQGTSSDTFIFNVFNSLAAGNGGDIILSGGITPGQILWNYVGTSGANISGNLSDPWQGTVLAPNAQIAASGRTFTGALIADDKISITGNPVFNYAGFAPAAVPEPAALVIGGSGALIGLIISGWRRWRRTARPSAGISGDRGQ